MMGGKTRQWATRNPRHTHTKNAGPQFNLLPDAEPMDYFILFLTMNF
jgi:hypothetical protein